MYHYIHSHFGVYAKIINAERQILLIRKARGPYTGLLDLPGGSLEPLETLEEALQREILEETGTQSITMQQLQAVRARYIYNNAEDQCCLRHIGVIYAVTIAGDINTQGDTEDAASCGWFDIDTLPESEVTPFVSLANQL